MFTPLMVDDPSEPRPAAARAIAKLEIRVDDVVIRTEVEADRLADVIRAVRASR
jgi:ribosomal protein S11